PSEPVPGRGPGGAGGGGAGSAGDGPRPALPPPAAGVVRARSRPCAAALLARGLAGDPLRRDAPGPDPDAVARGGPPVRARPRAAMAAGHRADKPPARRRPAFGRPRVALLSMVRIVRLGSPRAPGEGVRIGTVRRPPRGVPKSEYATRDLYDVWLPGLAPSG